MTHTLSAGQAPSGPPVFTAAQAAAGRGIYTARCAGCHAADMQGRNEASPLAGPNFMNIWRTRTAGDLATYIQSSVQREVNEANQAFESSWNSAAETLQAGATPMTPLEPPPPVYKRPNKKWRLKRGATPMWFKQRQGVRRQAQSGAARVARFRPPRLR